MTEQKNMRSSLKSLPTMRTLTSRKLMISGKRKKKNWKQILKMI